MEVNEFDVQNCKWWLRQIKMLDKEVDSLLLQSEELKHTYLKVAKVKPDSVQESRKKSDWLDTLEKVSDLKLEANRKIDVLVKAKILASSIIDQIDDQRYRNTLRDYYLSYKTWEEIAVAQNWHIQTVYNNHGQALLEFTRIAESRENLAKELRKSIKAQRNIGKSKNQFDIVYGEQSDDKASS